MRSLAGLVAGLILFAAVPRTAAAFCGFYVADGDTRLYNNATMVVMMRDGTRTVLSMQNNYQGPPSDFAMVVPVPVVLQEDNVKTLPNDVFDRVDKLAAPRLVEYWEQDPCQPPQPEYDMAPMAGAAMDMDEEDSAGDDRDYKVKIEAKFTVGEYDILILSAEDATGLDRWLKKEHYKIPDGAAQLLRPYVAQGMKFFVAKVNVKKVRFEHGMAMLSPLRFHYDAAQFNLPIRLGLMNSNGTQDLLVHILAPGQRYEVANYENVTIPTNLNVKDEARKEFASFYATLFDATQVVHPRSVVTEYSWDAGSCDPCPIPPLSDDDIATLGGDVLGNTSSYGYVLTRLHARYGKDSLGDDLVFRTAPPIVGGREFVVGEGGALERGAREDSTNNFQARYIIRHAWTGPITCDNPQRGIWGGPPGGSQQIAVKPAEDVAFAPRGNASLGGYLKQDVEELDYHLSDPDRDVRFRPAGIPGKASSCAGCASGGDVGGALAVFLLAGLASLVVRRRRRLG
jgi:uncharacterized protein (TIGR03382 family)